jgi:cytochrome bd-type quinol oxidase subunit 2
MTKNTKYTVLTGKQPVVLIVVLLSVLITVLYLAHHKLNKANKEGDEHSAKVARVYLTLLYMSIVLPLLGLILVTVIGSIMIIPLVLFVLLPIAAFVYITYLAHHHLNVAKRSGNRKTVALARFYLALYYITMIPCIVSVYLYLKSYKKKTIQQF